MSISYNIFISLVFSCNQTGVRGYYDLVNNGKILVSDSSFEPQRFSKGEAIHRLKNEVDFEVDSDANGEVVGNSVDVEYRAGDENGMGGNSVEELFQQNQDDKLAFSQWPAVGTVPEFYYAHSQKQDAQESKMQYKYRPTILIDVITIEEQT
ncbi:hypothetical protein LOK49_LG11G00802 [Camellia lanceoleosa]|uniref:Uncharacterized protein n=1 Tax=Camellia lanceoleosa TaxID=1840588 RepID=A0ACC0G256_9ERIC|nr:hypothetical protein LOK49_LG11G00802 [Camellia lanceoleosa]